MNSPTSANAPDAIATTGVWERLVRFGLVPAALYLLTFVALTWPVIRTFMTHIWAGDFDGYQMVWNVWWLNRAVTELHQLPWYTRDLFFPEGTSLLVHTLHPIKSAMAIPLIPWLGLGPSYNALLIVSFVLSGLTAFWLVYALSRSYAAGLLGGFIFSFSSYHFAHALGHMQLVSMEAIPLFVLVWLRLLERPRVRTAIAAAVVLFLVLLCDHYYFLYGVMVGGFMIAWHSWQTRRWGFMFQAPHRLPLAVFALATAATSGVLVGATLGFMRRDPSPFFFGADKFSLDLFGLLIPGGRWRFNALTEPYWSRLTCNVNETSVHLGVAVLSLVAYALVRRRRMAVPGGVGLWLAMGTVFAILALGPRLHVAGWTVPYLGDWEVPLLRMPYALVAKIVPGLDVGARPIRLVVITILCGAVVAPLALRDLWNRGRGARVAASGLLVLMLVEFLPSPVFALRTEIPPFVNLLRARSDGGALYDAVTRDPLGMFYQTVHEHPISYGYTSRAYTSQYERSGALKAVYVAGRYADLRDHYGFRYLAVPHDVAVTNAVPEATLLCVDSTLSLYDLGPRKEMPHDP